MTEQYNSTELLACVAARLLENKKSALVGTGLPISARSKSITTSRGSAARSTLVAA